MACPEEAVLLRGKRQRVESKKAARVAAREEKEKLGTAKKLAARTKGGEIEAICPREELEGFRLSGGDG